jgi:hypothetical protein
LIYIFTSPYTLHCPAVLCCTDTNDCGKQPLQGPGPQSRQSAKLFLHNIQSSELGLPHPFSRRRVCPPPLFGPGGGRVHSLAGKGLGESQFRRGDIHCGTLYILDNQVKSFDEAIRKSIVISGVRAASKQRSGGVKFHN